MKTNKKWLAGAIIAVLVLAVITVAAVAALSSERANNILNAIVNGDEYAVENDLNGDGKVNVIDAILAVKQDALKGPFLSELTIDGGYSINFAERQTSYVVNLPAGRPRIPRVSASAADGCDVKVEQATIADTESYGYARVTVSDNSGMNVYNIKFVKAEADGAVVLQYDDRYTFTPDYQLKTGESFTFESSDASIVSVDADGVLVAKAVSDTAVTVTAKVDGTAVDTLEVTKIDKAQVSLFFVTGQSNGQGCYDFNESSSLNITAADQIKAVEMPEVEGRVYSFDVYPRSADNPEAYAVKGTLYDMAVIPRQGFAPALGKTYYNLSGEKVVFLQSAYSGAPIERWLDPNVHADLAETSNNYYQGTQNGYNTLMSTYLTEDKFEIIRRENFWLQGETCMGSVWDYDANNWKSPGDGETLFTDEDYENMFLKVHNQMIDDFGISSSHLLLPRAHGVSPNADTNVKAYLSPVRASQYGMGNTYDDITVVSRLSDVAVIAYDKYKGTMYEPYMGYMGVGNVHYNQIGHNANGRIAAENFFKSIDVETKSFATSVEIIDTNGIDRIENGTLFEIEVGQTKRLAAFALPEYSLENVTWSSSDAKVAKVSRFGLITVVGEGDATITAIAESGAKSTVKVKGLEKTTKEVHYRWDFNGNLTSSADANDLRLSDLATANNAQGNYSFKDGAIVVEKSVAQASRPDFTMEFPVNISSKVDWSIEWKAKFYSNSVFLGQECCNTTLNTTTENKARQINHLYSIHTSSNFSGNAYPLRFVDSTATDHWLSYTADYKSLCSGSRNAWKLSYTAETGLISLSVLKDGVWVVISTTPGGTFEATFNNVLGRYNAEALVNFVGEMDYLDIKVGPAKIYEDVHYRWDFDGNLESSADKNTLTMTQLSADAGAETVFDADKKMIVSSGSLADAKRPNYKMENPVVLTREFDWAVEWKSKLAGGSGILGQETSSQDKNFMYAAYGTAAYQYGLKIDDDKGGHVYLPYADNGTDATNLNTNAFRCWKVSYTVATNTLALEMSEDEGVTWTTLSTYQPAVSEFDKVTYNTLFGRYNAAGLVNFRGTMDYMDIKFKKAVEKEYTVYDWQFNDYTSSADKNTLTPSGTEGFSIDEGIYTTTGRKIDELILEKPINLDSSESWHIEWCYVGSGAQSNSLFGTVDCGVGKTNHIYLAASTYTGDFKSPCRILFSDGSRQDLFFVKDATDSSGAINLNKVWNIWRLEYDKPTRTLSLKVLNASKVWQVCDSVVMTRDFSLNFTRMFGDFNGQNMVNMYGSVDYVKVYFVDKTK